MVFADSQITINKLKVNCVKMDCRRAFSRTILKVYKIRNREPEREFTFSFLCTIAKNLFIDKKRKNRKVIGASLE
ncbi:hypothetical protein CWS20_27260 [Cytobacillus horneckiae]|uniref:Uncharacterized protein n=1 Tax=Cytobacillus horneckiae TaxID=549687 RepID=A0A2N0Z8K0_9BACI|nr:hypothetical protein CWS20_27260 [Cytobacillus horneckiae]